MSGEKKCTLDLQLSIRERTMRANYTYNCIHLY